MKIDSLEKIKSIIIDRLSGLIGKECILVDAPYYNNVGDVLIWAGTRQYLKEQGVRILYTCSYRTCSFPKISNSVTVLFHGGGNLGNLYPEHSDFLLQIIKRYPNNNIVILPQTLFFNNLESEHELISMIKCHGKVHLCARDSFVYERYASLLGNNCSLVPDMAFFLYSTDFLKSTRSISKDTLYIVRKDAEACSVGTLPVNSIQIHDWPTIESIYHWLNIGNLLFEKVISHINNPFFKNKIAICWDYYASHFFINAMIKTGVNFVSSYKKIVTTRLHGGILSCILSKEVVLTDNNYGKNAHFYDTWLCDIKNVRLYSNE